MGNAGIWLRMIGSHNGALIKQLRLQLTLSRPRHHANLMPRPPSHLSSYQPELSSLLSSYLRRESICLSASTPVFVQDGTASVVSDSFG